MRGKERPKEWLVRSWFTVLRRGEVKEGEKEEGERREEEVEHRKEGWREEGLSISVEASSLFSRFGGA